MQRPDGETQPEWSNHSGERVPLCEHHNPADICTVCVSRVLAERQPCRRCGRTPAERAAHGRVSFVNCTLCAESGSQGGSDV
jgi:hypothetical protein